MDTQEATQTKRHKSPNFPACSLPAAISKAQLVWDNGNERNSITAEKAGELFGYSTGSSGLYRVISTLRAFGLAEITSGGARDPNLTMKLTERAVALIHDTNGGEVDERKAAAVGPKLYRELIKKWPHSLPSDELVRTHMIVERRFKSSLVPGIIRDFRETVKFAELLDGIVDYSEPDEDTLDEQFQESEAKDDGISMSQRQVQTTPPRQPEEVLAPHAEVWRLSGGVTVTLSSTHPLESHHYSQLVKYIDVAKNILDEEDDPDNI